MTAVAAPVAPAVIVDPSAIRRQRILGIVYVVIAAVIAYFLTNDVKAGDTTTFVLKPAGSQGLDVPSLVVPSLPTIYIAAAICAALGAIQLIRGFGTRWAVILGIVVVALVFAFLTWTAAGKSMSLIGILQLTVQKALPITFGALSGVLCERAGVVNIAIEGLLLSGAVTGAVVGRATHNNLVRQQPGRARGRGPGRRRARGGPGGPRDPLQDEPERGRDGHQHLRRRPDV